ncbi:MAG: hypothetical protein HN730_01420, partial [Bdellovibrionales bacterium]|nr:hypothetical protein [Bdellovibrionales bacterium]
MRKQTLILISLVTIFLILFNSTVFAGSKNQRKVKSNMSQNYQLMTELMANILIHNNYSKIVSITNKLQLHVNQLKKMSIKNKSGHQYGQNIETLNSHLFSMNFTAKQLVAAERSHKKEQGYWLRPKAAE